MVEEEEAAIARQQDSKHVSAAMNQDATTEELLEVVYSVQSVLRLYNEDQWKKLFSQRFESVVSNLELHC
jgi:hypothetical protein